MTLKELFFLLGLGLSLNSPGFAHAQQTTTQQYNFTLDLTNVQDDRILVTLLTPGINQQEIIYNMPKVVPGTYSVSDFGKYVTDFKALNKNGKALEVEQLDTNRWKIKNATQLNKITYWANDTFDAQKREDVLFEPGGTNIEEKKNFLLNTFGFMGYFDDMKSMPFELNITKPAGFYGSTPLKAISATATSDKYLVPDYMQLADSPLMYNMPDTTTLNIGDAKVLVSVYSPSGKVTSGAVAANVKDILEAQRRYLGGTLPVDKYAFIIYVSEKGGKSGAFGALEHPNSSVYFLPEMPEAMFSSTFRDMAAHEFFHIVTPLGIHSEEIGNFDYINPKMSKHLWLYEGATEYFASHVQAYENLYDLNNYLNKLREYIITAKTTYNDTLPFTEMSAGVLDKYAGEYSNVYQKGALIGLVLDVKLRELSGGKYGLRNLMVDLSETYGKEKSFKDAELFDKIAELTYPEIRTFFAKYVEGATPLPLEETFRKAGIIYEPKGTATANSYGGFALGYDQESGRLVVAGTGELDAFGSAMGFEEGDQLLAMNGTDLTPMNIHALISEQLQQMKPGEKITITVGRKNKNGKLKKKKLKGTVTPVQQPMLHVLKPDPNATPQQLQLRAAWLNSQV